MGIVSVDGKPAKGVHVVLHPVGNSDPSAVTPNGITDDTGVFNLIGQRQFWRKPSVFATRSVSEGLYLTRSLAYASGYYFEKSGAVQLTTYSVADGAPEGSYQLSFSWPEPASPGAGDSEDFIEKLPQQYQYAASSGVSLEVNTNTEEMPLIELSTL